MFFFNRQKPKAFPRHPGSGIIEGAEPFEFGEGGHALLFIHGWTSSPREMRFLAETLQELFFCRGVLLDGHGLNVESLRNTRWQGYFNQVSTAFRELRAGHDKVSIVGLSYGAILALHLASVNEVANLVLLSPFMKSSKKVFNLIPASKLVKYFPPFIRDVSKSAQGPIFNRKEEEKHIAYHIMPVRPFKSIMASIEKVRCLLPGIHCPVLLIHSKGDMTADFSGSEQILEQLGSQDKSLVILNNCNHVITLDYERTKVEKIAKNWLVERI